MKILAYLRTILLVFLTLWLIWFIFRFINSHYSPTPAAPAVMPVFPYSQNLPLPTITATHVFIEDVNSRAVLYASGASDPVYPASTTKMMTALVSLAHYSSTEVVSTHTGFAEGQRLGLVPGEQFQADQLLYALLVYSANDAAEELADNYPGGRQAFVAEMNRQATRLHLTNTRFKNPTGLDEDGHFSTAVDLARLAQALMFQPKLAKIVATENAVISTTDYSSTYVLTNVNQLLGSVPGVMGVKTGFTDLAGQSLVTWVNRDNHPVVISLLGSQDRFRDTTALIDWVYSNYSWTILNGDIINP